MVSAKCQVPSTNGKENAGESLRSHRRLLLETVALLLRRHCLLGFLSTLLDRVPGLLGRFLGALYDRIAGAFCGFARALGCALNALLVMARRSRVARLRLSVVTWRNGRLVYRRGALEIRTGLGVVHVRTLRYPDDIGRTRLACAAANIDPAGIDALLLHQVSLGVHCALRRQIHLVALLAGELALLRAHGPRFVPVPTIGAFSPSA